MNASQFTAASSFTANSMYASLPYAVNGKMKGAIYSNNSGSPANKLGVTSEITNPTGGGFIKLTGLNVSIKSGTKYWLVIWSDAAYSVDGETSGGLLQWKTRTYGSWPASFPTPAGSSVVKLSIYVDGLKGAYLNDSTNLTQSLKETNTISGNRGELMVFPNPVTNGVLNINLKLTEESAELNIIDLTGRVMCSKAFASYSGTQQIDISNLKKGIYIVNITQGDSNYTSKLIIE